MGLMVNALILPSGRNSPFILYKWREAEIIAEGKGMNTWVMQRGKSNILLKRPLAQLCQMPKRLKPHRAETTPSFGT